MRTILLFHGLGGNENTMAPVGKYCIEVLKDTRFISLQGMVKVGAGRTPLLGWFQPPSDANRALEGPDRPVFGGLASSLAYVHRKIDQLIDKGTGPEDIHLLGHSQGGAVAIAAGLTYTKRIGSVCTVAGYLALTPQSEPTVSGTKYFLHHSDHDRNVSVRWAYYARDFVDQLGEVCKLRTWKISRLPHSIHSCQLDQICGEIRDC